MYIPRGYKQNYIPGLSGESKILYEGYKKQHANYPFDNGTLENGNALMNTMKEDMGGGCCCPRTPMILASVDVFSVCGGALLDRPCIVFQRVCVVPVIPMSV